MSIFSLSPSDIFSAISFFRRRIDISFVDPMPEAEVNAGIIRKLAIRITNNGNIKLCDFTVSACPSLRFGYTTSEHYSYAVSQLLPGDSVEMNVFDPLADIRQVTYTVTLRWYDRRNREKTLSRTIHYTPR